MAGGGEFLSNVIDREIAFAHGQRQIADAVAGRCRLRSTLRLAKEGGAFVGVVTELVAEDAKSTHGIAETAGDVAGGFFINDEGAESFILTLHGELGGEEEVLIGGSNYLIHSTGPHNQMMLPKHYVVKLFRDRGPGEAGKDHRAGTDTCKSDSARPYPGHNLLG